MRSPPELAGDLEILTRFGRRSQIASSPLNISPKLGKILVEMEDFSKISEIFR